MLTDETYAILENAVSGRISYHERRKVFFMLFGLSSEILQIKRAVCFILDRNDFHTRHDR